MCFFKILGPSLIKSAGHFELKSQKAILQIKQDYKRNFPSDFFASTAKV